ncbi:MAG: protein kinase domain-containing protein, partial [Planctomycetota bacterium]
MHVGGKSEIPGNADAKADPRPDSKADAINEFLAVGGLPGSARERASKRIAKSHGSHDGVNELGYEGTRVGNPDASPDVVSGMAAAVAMESPVGSPTDLGRRLEGLQLGHYLLEQFVGGGGMGAVFRATDTRLSRIVAVKVMARDRTDEDTLRRFQNEAQSAARLDHPNIARVYYVGEDAGLNFIVFEYIEGTNIRDYVQRRGPLPLEESINFTMQLAEALEHAHLRSVVHRDIKPSNVLVTGNGQLKLVDMGLARMHQVKAADAELTATGVTLGTFDYISPEQAKDPRSADVRSDLYSLGCTLFFMLTGRPPFPDGTVLQKLLSHSSEPPPDILALRGDLDAELAELVGKLLAKLPSQRFQTPGELIGALLLIADRLGFDRLARPGVVVMAAPVGFWAFVERQLPWLAPCVLFIAGMAAMRWGSNSEVGPAWVPLRPSYEPMAAAGLPVVPLTQEPNAVVGDEAVRAGRSPRSSPSETSSPRVSSPATSPAATSPDISSPSNTSPLSQPSSANLSAQMATESQLSRQANEVPAAADQPAQRSMNGKMEAAGAGNVSNPGNVS